MITNEFLTHALNRTKFYKSSGNTSLVIGLMNASSELRTTVDSMTSTQYSASSGIINIKECLVTCLVNATITKIGIYTGIEELIVSIDIPSVNMVNGQLATIKGAGETYFGLVNA